MVFSLASRDGANVLTLYSLPNESEGARIMAAIDAELEKGYRNFVVDLSGMQYINSVGINLLIRLKRKCKAARGRIALFHASGKVKELLDITRLRSMFFLTDSMEEALLFLRA